MLLVIAVIVAVLVIFFVAFMALPVPNYGLGTPCPSCPDRKDPAGVWHWSAVARHYPGHSAATMHKLIKWLKRMSQAQGVCNDCCRVLNMVAIELATIVTDQ